MTATLRRSDTELAVNPTHGMYALFTRGPDSWIVTAQTGITTLARKLPVTFTLLILIYTL